MSSTVYETDRAIVTRLAGRAGIAIELMLRHPDTGQWQDPVRMSEDEFAHMVGDAAAGWPPHFVVLGDESER